MQIDHRLVMELFREEGDAVGHVEVSPDWHPAIEWTRLTGLRTHGVWAPESSAERSLEPLWHEKRGEPHARGFRVHLAAANGTTWSEDFPMTYLADLARAASASLVDRGVLASGESVLYRVMAYGKPDTPALPEANGFTAADVPVPLAMRDVSFAAMVERSAPAGDTHDSDVAVFLPHAVLNEAAELTKAAGDVETGGVLIGHLARDIDRKDIAVEITALIPARHTVGNATKLTFTSETWTDVRHAVALRSHGELILGWFHSHPMLAWCREKECSPEAQAQCSSAEGFFSADDAALHRTMFPRAYTVALVMTLSIKGIRPRLFGWREGRLQPRGYRVVTRSTSGDRTYATATTV